MLKWSNLPPLCTIVEELKEDVKKDNKAIIVQEAIEVAIGDIDFEGFDSEEEEEEIFLFVEEMPTFPGGEEALLQQISNNLNYPRQAQRIGIEGRVHVKFVIYEDGSIRDIEIMKGIGAGCDEEAKRVLASLPNFKPGKQRGTPVKVQMQIPIYFRLN